MVHCLSPLATQPSQHLTARIRWDSQGKSLVQTGRAKGLGATGSPGVVGLPGKDFSLGVQKLPLAKYLKPPVLRIQ